MNATSSYLNHQPRTESIARLDCLANRVREEMTRNNALLSRLQGCVKPNTTEE